MKSLALIKRRPDLARAEFRDHYEDVHVPLAIETVLDGTTRYVRNHLVEVLHGEAAFDVATAFWYADLAAALAVAERLETPVGEAILADELRFMDKPANRVLPVSEHPISGEERPGAPLAALALVGAPVGEPGADFCARYEADWLPRLAQAVADPRWCLQNRALAPGGEPPVFDAVTQLHAEADAGLAAWAEKLEAEGARALVVRVEECESALGPVP